jgi:hypothetical protein
MKKLDKANVIYLRRILNTALTEIGMDQEIHMKVGKIKYDGKSATFIIEAGIINEDGSVIDPEASCFLKYCHTIGMKPEDLGQSFMYQNRIYKITGMNKSRPKFPLSAIAQSGQKYKLPKTFAEKAVKI